MRHKRYGILLGVTAIGLTTLAVLGLTFVPRWLRASAPVPVHDEFWLGSWRGAVNYPRLRLNQSDDRAELSIAWDRRQGFHGRVTLGKREYVIDRVELDLGYPTVYITLQSGARCKLYDASPKPDSLRGFIYCRSLGEWKLFGEFRLAR